MSSHIIELNNLTFTYPGSDQPVLKDVSLQIKKGDFLAVIGSNGSGKSTLCKCFNGLIPHYYTGDFSGNVIVNGQSAEGRSVAELSKHIGYVYQDFENQLVRPTVIDDVSFTPLNYGYADYQERGERALMLTGLREIKNEFIWQLSGGQKHLLALAGALAMDPEILVIDEPVAQLDPQHARHIYDILRQLNEVHGKTIVVIEHHADFIAEYCKNVILMDGGSILWHKPVREAMSSVDELLELGIYPPDVTQAARMLEQGIRPGQLYPLNVEEGSNWFIRKYTNAEAVNPSVIVEHTSHEANLKKEVVVNLEDVHLSYRTIHKTSHPVLKGIDLELYPGESIALIGNNGAGKSSLMKLIAGIVKPTAGVVHTKGIKVNKLPAERLSGIAAYVFQNPEEMFIEDSVYKEIAYYLKARKLAEADKRVDEMLAAFRLSELAERDARLLSGGQQRRVSLAIGAAVRPAIMLLDEPTANLDISTKRELIQVLETLGSHVETVVIATHDMQLVAEWASRIIVMHEGQIIADGSKDDIFADDQLLRRAGLAQTQLMELSRALGLPSICCSLKDFVNQTAIQRGELIYSGSCQTST